MKQIKLIVALLVLSTVFSITSCNKDKTTEEITSGETITASFFGKIEDENGVAIQNATVKAGSLTFNTDRNGVFKIQNANVDKRNAFISVTKSGFFDGSRTIRANANKSNYVKIVLIRKNLSASFNASSGSTVAVGSTATVTFAPNSIKKADGTAYSGTVKVFATHLQADDNRLYDKMPGNLIGTRTNNDETMMRTFGMLNVVLEDPSGNKLNIADGQTAKISMQVPSSILSSAPNSIVLWHFDEGKGLWREEGTATLNGNTYEGTVSHFSWWNCDTPEAAINLCLRLIDQNGNPLRNVQTILTNTANNDTRVGYGDQEGRTCGLVYSNVVLKLEYVDVCGNRVFIQNIGPFSSDTNIGDIAVVLDPASTGFYSGQLLNCSGNPVANGYLIYSYNGIDAIAEADANGNYQFSVRNCGTLSNFSAIGVDVNTLEQGFPQNIAFNIGNNTIAPINACGTALDEYVIYQIDGGPAYTSIQPTIFADFSTSTPEMAYISVHDSLQSGRNVSFGFTGIAPYQVQFINFNIGSTYYYTPNLPGLNANIISYANAINEYIEGTLTGTFLAAESQSPSGQSTHTINCTFRIKRRH